MPSPKTPAPKETRSAEQGVNFDDLTTHAKDKLLVEARKMLEADIGKQLREHITGQVTAELRGQIIEKDQERRRRRALAFLNDLLPLANRLATYLPKEVHDGTSIEELVGKWPGTVVNSRQHMTVIGMISTIGWNLTCDENGENGYKLVGVINPANRALMGFRWKGGPEHLKLKADD